MTLKIETMEEMRMVEGDGGGEKKLRSQSRRLLEQLQEAQAEKEVENAWWSVLGECLGMTFDSDFKTDGYGQRGDLRLLMEFKDNKQLGVAAPLCEVVAQGLHYCSQFQSAAKLQPNVLMLGDRDEVVLISMQELTSTLEMPFKWGQAPSDPDPDLVSHLVGLYEKGSLKPFRFIVDTRFDLGDFLESLESLSRNEAPKIRVTPENLSAVYRRWEQRVFNRIVEPEDGGDTSDIADVFLRSLCFEEGAPEGATLEKPSLLVIDVDGNRRKVAVRRGEHRAFFEQFRRPSSREEKAALVAAKDRILEETQRRMQGAFFTPPIWAEEAQLLLDATFGSDWRADSLVWDSASGTGNLTRGRRFPNLLLSSLEVSDVKTCKDQPNHAEALCFAYDFLADTDSAEQQLFDELPADVDHVLRSAAIEGKRLVFIVNPPFGTAGNMDKSGAKKTEIAKTKVNLAMIEEGLRKPAQQLYAQFMYRISTICEAYGFQRYAIGLFSKPNFITAPSYQAFREYWYQRFGFVGGFLFQASHFASVSGKWGVSFTLWKEGETDLDEHLSLQLLDTDDSNTRIERGGIKLLYSSVGRRAFEWARGNRLKSEGDSIQLKSGLTVNPTGKGRDLQGHLGWFNNDSNDVYHSGTTVWLQSAGKSSTNNNAGWFLTKENFVRSLVLFSVRKAVRGTWINDKDEFLAPIVPPGAEDDWELWVTDCLVAALAEPSNTCCGAKGLTYKGAKYDLRNQLFWMTASEVSELASSVSYKELEDSAQLHRGGTPHLLIALEGRPMSDDAKGLLELLRRLTKNTAMFREDYGYELEEDRHLGVWDAGYYQLKGLFEARSPEDWKLLVQARKRLDKRVTDGIGRFRFLLE